MSWRSRELVNLGGRAGSYEGNLVNRNASFMQNVDRTANSDSSRQPLLVPRTVHLKIMFHLAQHPGSNTVKDFYLLFCPFLTHPKL